MFKKGIDELEKIIEEKEIDLDIQRAIIGSMKGVCNGNHPHSLTFGRAHY